MKLSINDLKARITEYDSKLKDAVNSVIESGWLVMGPHVKQFELSFARYIGAKNCVSLANGTDAIELALRAFGITCGDKVATVANAGMYTTTALSAIGAEPFFLDVELSSRNTNLDYVKDAVNNGVKAVVVTHLYGLAVSEIEEIAKYCRQQGVFLLEDCAQAHGARIGGHYVGTFGDAASFSFYPTKNLGALGDGGAVLTNSDVIADRVSRLRQYGWKTKYQVGFPAARNSRLDEIQAAALSVFLPDLDQTNSRRRAVATQYLQQITHAELMHPSWQGEEYVAHLYVIRTLQRQDLAEHLRKRGIATDIHYPIPDYRQPVFNNRFDSINLKNTEILSSQILTLPCYPEMTKSQVQEVITAVNTWQP